MDSTVTTSRPFEAIYSVTQGVTQTEYNLIINGTTYTYTQLRLLTLVIKLLK